MNTLDIVLINVICYLGGVLSGLGICFKYKKHLLFPRSLQENHWWVRNYTNLRE